MKFSPEVINKAYLSLKETLGHHKLGITKSLILATINLHGQSYYLIQNLTNKNFELIFDNDKSITLTSKIFISSVKPIKAKELFINVPNDQFQKLSTFDEIIQTKQEISKRNYLLVELNQEVLDENFKDNKFLNKNLKYNDYIYSIDFPKEIKDKVVIEQTDTHLKILLHPDRDYSLLHTILVDNVIYTNNPIRVNNALEKLMLAIPNQKTKELEYIRSNMYYSVRSISDKLLKLPLTSLPDQHKFKQLINDLRDLFV